MKAWKGVSCCPSRWMLPIIGQGFGPGAVDDFLLGDKNHQTSRNKHNERIASMSALSTHTVNANNQNATLYMTMTHSCGYRSARSNRPPHKNILPHLGVRASGGQPISFPGNIFKIFHFACIDNDISVSNFHSR